MEQQEFDALLTNWLQRQRQQQGDAACSAWAAAAGITDGTAGQAFVTRDEAVQMLQRALEYFFRQLILVLQEP